MTPHLPRTCRPSFWLALATAAAVGAAHAQLPTGASVVHGSAAIAASGNRMSVTNTPNAILNWQRFSIGADAAVRFQQQSAASAVLNRVVGQDPSSILGQLSSNGGVLPQAGIWACRLPSAARPTAGFAQPAGCCGATHASRIPASPPSRGRLSISSLRSNLRRRGLR